MMIKPIPRPCPASTALGWYSVWRSNGITHKPTGWKFTPYPGGLRQARRVIRWSRRVLRLGRFATARIAKSATAPPSASMFPFPVTAERTVPKLWRRRGMPQLFPPCRLRFNVSGIRSRHKQTTNATLKRRKIRPQDVVGDRREFVLISAPGWVCIVPRYIYRNPTIQHDLDE